jgi:hypothetical protein
MQQKIHYQKHNSNQKNERGMKKIQWLPILICVTIFAIITPILPWIAALVGMMEQGKGPDDPSYAGIPFLIANWASLLLRVYPTVTDLNGDIGYDAGKALFSIPVIIVNGLGWALIGFIIGLVISAVKGKRDDS